MNVTITERVMLPCSIATVIETVPTDSETKYSAGLNPITTSGWRKLERKERETEEGKWKGRMALVGKEAKKRKK